jgi:hypothetical protein
MPKYPKPNAIEIKGNVAVMSIAKRNGEVIKTIFDAEDIPKVKSVYYRWYAHYEARFKEA